MKKTLTLLAILSTSPALADENTVIEMRQQTEERRVQQALEQMQRDHYEIRIERNKEQRREYRREARRELHHEREREYERERRSEDERECKPRISLPGTEHISISNARTSAVNAWQEAVRWNYGERYMDLNIARDLKSGCNQSSTPEGIVGRVEAAVGAIKHRCEVSAIPCRAALRSEDK